MKRRVIVIIVVVLFLLSVGNAALLYHDHNEFVLAAAALTAPPTDENMAALADVVGDDPNNPRIGVLAWWEEHIEWALVREGILVVVAGLLILNVMRRSSKN